jgi:hypothetical protein
LQSISVLLKPCTTGCVWLGANEQQTWFKSKHGQAFLKEEEEKVMNWLRTKGEKVMNWYITKTDDQMHEAFLWILLLVVAYCCS